MADVTLPALSIDLVGIVSAMVQGMGVITVVIFGAFIALMLVWRGVRYMRYIGDMRDRQLLKEERAQRRLDRSIRAARKNNANYYKNDYFRHFN